jgi:hypothetical protein
LTEISEARLGCPLLSAAPKTFGAPHDLVQFLEQINLVINQQLRVTDHVD